MNKPVVNKMVALLAVVLTSRVATADRIELEVFTDRNSPPTAAHEWMQALKELNVDRLRFRQDQIVRQPAIHTQDQEGHKVHRVMGIIQGGNQLHVPGATFSKFEVDRFNNWLAELPQRVEADAAPHAFGTTAEQLVLVRDALKRPIVHLTKDKPLTAFLRQAAAQLPIELSYAALPADSHVTEELSGLSYGTGLAAALRPHGLVLVPAPTGAQAPAVRLEINSVRAADAHWPVGWPRQQRPNELAPKLYDFLQVEINDVPLAKALAAIQPRLKLPFLFDQNGMARHDIDPQTAKVSYPNRRTFYKKMLNNLLFQAKLKSELRVDEAGQPFLWISPVKD